jgi:hypothetical protein
MFSAHHFHRNAKFGRFVALLLLQLDPLVVERAAVRTDPALDVLAEIYVAAQLFPANITGPGPHGFPL